jgi:hypothetical protein
LTSGTHLIGHSKSADISGIRPFWDRSRIHATSIISVLPYYSYIMQSIAAKASLVRIQSLRSAPVRTFVSSTSRWQAVPTEKPVLQKEFKIYRWVRPTNSVCAECLFTLILQNPDEPAKKPTLQSYTIDLNQTGPMVSSLAPFRTAP